MASRRARIKCVANIPVRRRNDGPNTTDNAPPEPKKKEENLKTEESLPQANSNEKNEETTKTDTEKTDITNKHNDAAADNTETNNNQEKCTLETDNSKPNIPTNDKFVECSIEVPKTIENDAKPPIKPSRRWTSKPSVRIPTRQPKPEPKKPESCTEIQTTPPEQLEEAINKDDAISNQISETTEADQPKNPLSPSKSLNRVRIRPAPKLIRRNSMQGSASESEDDGRRSRNRIRNDSVCSTSSLTLEISHTKDACTKSVQYNSIIQRKCRRSEQSRRMAEARREFMMKFGFNTPDKKKLTMMDLIFYNPTTNPMPKKAQQPIEPPKATSPQNEEEEVGEEEQSDEENIPVPQLKVGLDGEIILDEQSLVIEQTGAKRGREQLANSQIVNDDLNTGYGVYKRPKRSKDWSTTDTLKFYRALHTVGTDFSLMQPIFPNRQRRELKLKFKKEERINRQLIDKALLNPLEFNVAELKEQLEQEELMNEPATTKMSKKEKHTGKSKSLASEINEENLDKKQKRLRRKRKTMSILEDDIDDSASEFSDHEFLNRMTTELPLKRSDRLANKKVVRFNDDVAEEKEPDEPDEVVEIDSDNNQTICEDGDGDVDRVTESVTYNSVDKQTGEKSSVCVQSTAPPELPEVEPGSIMILSSVAPTGEPIYKVFMVTPGKQGEPAPLPPDVVSTLDTSLGGADAITLDLPVLGGEPAS